MSSLGTIARLYEPEGLEWEAVVTSDGTGRSAISLWALIPSHAGVDSFLTRLRERLGDRMLEFWAG
jgi:hypothetical protein